MDMKNKRVLVGVTGGIAAYKTADAVSMLVKTGAAVDVIMTKNATEFITPLTFETLTKRRCITDTFARDFEFDVAHISLAKAADVILIAPATANVIAKLAHGIADDMLTTTVLAAKCPKLVAPSMNTAMLENPITRDNIETLKKYGFEIIEPDSGRLACGDEGKGKLPSPETLKECVLRHIAREKTLRGVRVTVTAGATQEALDPVRFITNHSTGKMGYAVAREAMLRGAEVTLISGKTALAPPLFVNVRQAVSAADMFQAVQEELPRTDILIKTAAVADYRPKTFSESKIKKSGGEFSLPLERTEDILKWVGENRRPKLFVCGFSMETENLLENSREKLLKKGLDMIAANCLNTEGAGFGTDTNVITLITRDGARELPLMSKADAAAELLDEIERRRG
ncbi:MAG: bifunctional phosphopantothenoylcysteine decarboxylase/phosphopantothenate--cysteine ligase CoaBC [Lachnospiraceae bacterium]|nr:bifunctional phosphopantothenoylcysteine decarboxylase/phosphopantothenate--cysteine ligase CoaBC [Ruminococcus sp.]MCM1275269.1 bifunctional phosphopantothenoylcysteine decarboxylase/phosphopantothenate--cysteine ligase CoaBC [Lachnospiraceae bacterium]